MTASELARAALEEIGKAPAGGPYPNDDVEKVEEKYVGLHAMLLSKNLVTWALDEDIPAVVERAVLAMLAYAIASVFGVAEPRYSRLRLEGSVGDSPPSLAERQLRQSIAVPYVYAPVATEFF